MFIYACDGKDFQRFIAVVYQAKNILSFRSLKAYQEKPTDAQEKSKLLKGLKRLSVRYYRSLIYG